jgi:guanylate kinase
MFFYLVKELGQSCYNMAMILLTGASASGKTEVSKLLRKEYGIVKVVTHTTRAPRVNEKNGVDYYFVTKEEFLALQAKNFFVETTLYNGNFYGCSKREVSDDKCLIVEPNGLRSFLALGDQSIVTFLLSATEQTRRERMLLRGDDPEEVDKRLDVDRIDFDPIRIEPTDFTIETDERSLSEITNDIYLKYVYSLKSRGISPNIIVQ